MKEFRIKNIDYIFKFEDSCLWNIQIEHPKFLVDLIRQIKLEDEDIFYLYEKESLDPYKHLIFLDDYFCYDINNKKNLTNLYNKLEKFYTNDETLQKIDEINEKIKEIINNMINNYYITLDYEDTIDLKNLFSLVKIAYKEEGNSFLSSFINYVKVLKEINNKLCLIISLNLFDYLNLEEINDLINELKYEHIGLINIGRPKKGTNNIIIDNDLCEIINPSV